MSNKEAKPLVVNFASLDARDDVYTGYDVCAFTWQDKEAGQFILSRNALKLSALMQKEYLQRVRQLQDEIAAKYLAQVTEEDFRIVMAEDGDDEQYFKEDFEEASTQFPGPYASYYT